MTLPANNWTIGWTLFVALVITTLDLSNYLPQIIVLMKPDFALAIFFYWASNPKTKISFAYPWFFGFLFDAVYSEPLGLNAIIYCVVVYVGMRLSRNSNTPVLGYQVLLMLGAVLLAQVIRSIALQYVEFPVKISFTGILMSTLSTCAVWFVAKSILDRVLDDVPRMRFT